MSKKKKIIISSVIVGVILVGVILTLILVNIKRYSNYTELRAIHNNHTSMQEVGHNSAYSVNNATYYSNTTRIVTNANNGKYGVYSYEEDKLIADAIYNQIIPVYTNNVNEKTIDGTNRTYFRLKDDNNPNNIILINDHGKNAGIITYDTENKTSKAKIMVKDVEITNKRNNIKTKTKNKFIHTDIEVSACEITARYYMPDKYDYEVWNLTTLDGITYQNIYSLEGNGRTLVQTIGSTSGLSIELNTPMLYVLSNGKIRFVTINTPSSSSEPIIVNVYDEKYKLKKSNTIQSNLVEEALSDGIITKAGNNIILQYSQVATESDYDFIDTSTSTPIYYNYKTYKLSLDNGKFSEFNLKYLIEKATILNNETTVLTTKKINGKKIEETKYLLINNKLQTKEIKYVFDQLKQLNNNRFLAINNDGSSPDYTLIDKNFKLISRIGYVDDIFSTSNAILITRNNTTYVCNMDGIVVKNYNSNNVINLYHEDNYMVKVEKKQANPNAQNGSGYDEVVEYYLENLGYRGKLVYAEIKNTSSYTTSIDGVTIEKFLYYAEEDLSIMVWIIKNSESNYTYQIRNYDNTLLLEITGIYTSGMEFDILHSDKDSVLVLFDGGRGFVLNR